jgi:hypothetical protein
MAKLHILLSLIVASGSVALDGCRSTSEHPPDIAIVKVENPTVFLVAAKEKVAVRASLENADFTVENNHLATSNFLRVTVGLSQDFLACGQKHNVRYELAVDGTLAIDLRRVGYTGTCVPNVLDDLSEELYERLALPVAMEGEGS